MAVASTPAVMVTLISAIATAAEGQMLPAAQSQPVALVVRESRPTISPENEGASRIPVVWSGVLASQETLLPAQWWTPLISGTVPGMGQYLLRQQRGAAYAVAEAYLIIQYLGARRDGDRDREHGREIGVGR